MDVTLHTNQGDINVTLFPDHAPKTVDNFVGLAQGTKEWKDPATGQSRSEPFYDSLTFHRIIPGFMIQGGCPQGDGRGGPGYTFDDEIHPELAFTKPYLLAMANAGKAGGKGTNGSQFFVTVEATSWLQGKHTIFGEVSDQPSRDVIDTIVGVPTGPGDAPLEPVVIKSVTVG
jgi:peptidyl-prolyl cis-trans isomerase A (cyclophilin A)